MKSSFQLGIDLGGTKIEGVVLDAGRQLFRERILTEQHLGYDHILQNIQKLYQKMVSSIQHQTHSLGVGLPGAVSYNTGKLKNSNTLCLNQKPIQEDLIHWLQHPLIIENDANCFALAEAVLGSGKNCSVVFGVIMGTGCGGGIVINQHIHRGIQSIAGEWGHMSIDPDGPKCYCGKKGCVETYISGGGLEKMIQKQWGQTIPLIEIEKRYFMQDPEAIEFFDLFFDHFGRALSNVINILDPDVIVLGGGVSKFKALYDRGIAAVKKYVFSDTFNTPILQNQLGDSAGVIGAALLG